MQHLTLLPAHIEEIIMQEMMQTVYECPFALQMSIDGQNGCCYMNKCLLPVPSMLLNV